MTPEFTLTVDDIIKELNLGRATVNFMLERFARLLPHDRIQGRSCYSPDALSTLIRIKDLMDQGLRPSQIETAMEKSDPPAESNDAAAVTDVRMSQDALAFIQTLFQDIKGHQSRIARAHEKRAEAEERKAVAIEKRAEAEAKKAEAMNNIAAALQEMSRQRPVDTQTLEIAGHAAHALTMNETHDIEPVADTDGDTIDLGAGLDDTDLNDLFSPPGSDKELRGELDQTGLSPEELELDDLDLDDLGMDDLELDDLEMDDLTVEMPDNQTGDLDDLNQLVNEVSTHLPSENGEPEQGQTNDPDFDQDDPHQIQDTAPDDLEDLLNDPSPLPELDDLDLLLESEPDDRTEDLDDLSLLVNDFPQTDLPASSPGTSQALDDLSLLVDLPPGQDESKPDQNGSEPDLDDLYALVDSPASDTLPPPEDLDDLSLLVDTAPVSAPADLDDLSALIDPSDDVSTDLDDLSLLVDPGETATGQPHPIPQPMDDLSALISEEESDSAQASQPAEPSLKPDITPEQDMAKYKAAVMGIIIDLKNQGFNAADTTERLNRDEVPTLSGKPMWREKAIAKIYGFIDSAK